jgi:hypothetical protein
METYRLPMLSAIAPNDANRFSRTPITALDLAAKTITALVV